MTNEIENKNISQIALAKIKEEGIKPIPKKVFNFKRALFWALVVLSIAIGIISFSAVLSILFKNDWYLFNKFGFGFIFKTIPYFWFIFLLLLAIIGKSYYRKTLLGYRQRLRVVIGFYIIVTTIGGLIFYVIGLGNMIEESLSRNVPFYHGMMFDRDEFWLHPEEGLISGRIVLIDGNKIKIMDINNTLWVVNTDDAFIGKKVKMEEGQFLKIIGDIEGGAMIKAEQIRPWTGSHLNQNGNRGNIMR